MMPWGTQAGVNFVAASGYVKSSTVTYKGVPVFYDGRATSAGRRPYTRPT